MRKQIYSHLDIIDLKVANLGNFKQYDSLTLQLEIRNNQNFIDLTNNTIRLKIYRQKDKKMFLQTDGITIKNNIVTIKLKSSALALDGTTYCEMEIKDIDGSISTATFQLVVKESINPEGLEIPEEDKGILDKLITSKYDDVTYENNILSFYADKKKIKSVEIVSNPTTRNNELWKPSVNAEGLISWERSTSLEVPIAQNIKGPKGDKGETGQTGSQGLKGDTGDTGLTGPKGEDGLNGTNGINGQDGKSAYQVWLELGNTGSEQDFILSLKGLTGPKGDRGLQGERGPQGLKGETGLKGLKGDTGEPGERGLRGEQGIPGEVGPKGPQGEKGKDGTGINILGSKDSVDLLPPTGQAGDGWLVNGDLYVWDSSNRKWLNVGNIKGPKGDKGDPGIAGSKGDKGDTGLTGANGTDGVNGENGKSAYQIWLENNNNGTEQDFLNSLKGQKGDKGDRGLQGEVGSKGDVGEQGPQGLKGDAGSQGEQGIQGERGLKGDKGDQGLKGAKGEIGPQGPQGEAGTTDYNQLINKPDLTEFATTIQLSNGLDAIQVGGRNLIKNSGYLNNGEGWIDKTGRTTNNFTIITNDFNSNSSMLIEQTGALTSNWKGAKNNITDDKIISGKSYVISGYFYIYSTPTMNKAASLEIRGTRSSDDAIMTIAEILIEPSVEKDKWIFINKIFIPEHDFSKVYVHHWIAQNGKIKNSMCQLEQGTKCTDWTPAPIDIQRGAIGPKGEKGDKGDQGLKGDKGDTGLTGANGQDGTNGRDGQNGTDGIDGKSAYQTWLDNGNNGTEQDFITSLKGLKGDQGLKGDKGDIGLAGTNGTTFTPSVSSLGIISWSNNGNLNNPTSINIKGPKGDTGLKGDKGLQGEIGPQGERGLKGEQGPRGDIGPVGPKGDTGIFNINETYPTLQTTNKTVIGAINEINSKTSGGDGNGGRVIPLPSETPKEYEIFMIIGEGANYIITDPKDTTITGDNFTINAANGEVFIEFTSNGSLEIECTTKGTGYYMMTSNTGTPDTGWKHELKTYVFTGKIGQRIKVLANNGGWGFTVRTKTLSELCFNSQLGVKKIAFEKPSIVKNQNKINREVEELKSEIENLKLALYQASILPVLEEKPSKK